VNTANTTSRHYGGACTTEIIYVGGHNLERDFPTQINQILLRDSGFKDSLNTANHCLESIVNFFYHGGEPTFCIPELNIGCEKVLNINVLEFIYKLKCNCFYGLHVNWDYSGVEINRMFENLLTNGLERVDELLQNPLSIVESVDIIRSVLGSDPGLYSQEKTGDRFIKAVEHFYNAGGDILMPISANEGGFLDYGDCSIFELLSILYIFADRYCFDRTNWDHCIYRERANSEPSLESLFSVIFDRFENEINERLLKNSVADEGFITLIRCTLEFTEGFIDGKGISEYVGGKFLGLMEHFVNYKVDPNLTLSNLVIWEKTYTNIACFQVLYLVWKQPETTWDDEFDEKFCTIFNKVLTDRRIDLTHQFSEFEKVSDYIGTDIKLDGTLELMTIAHQCVLANDYITLTRLVKMEPSLHKLMCCLTIGKDLLSDDEGRRRSHANYYKILSGSKECLSVEDLEKNGLLSGRLEIVKKDSKGRDCTVGKIDRTSQVSLLHLAARLGFEGVIGCLIKHPYQLAVLDSDNKTPQDCLRLSFNQKIISNVSESKKMLRALEPKSFSPKSKVYPKVDQIVKREGYYLHYNTSRKVANYVYQRLGPNSFGNADRKLKWVDNLDIPKLNRTSDKDYIRSGYDRGHLVPANDATYSEERMKETFHPENAVPQNVNLNRGAWKCLEAYVHKLALIEGNYLQVFTGPIFVPTQEQSGRRISYPVIGGGDVHVPTHLFKIIFVYTKTLRSEVYIFPNEEVPKGKKFTDYQRADFNEGIEYIQKYTGIIFDQWLQHHTA